MDAVRMIDSHGHRIAVLAGNEDAAGTPLVLIHGVTSSPYFWPGLTPWLLQGRPWYALGLPCHYPSVGPEDFSAESLHDAAYGELMSDVVKQLVGVEPVIAIGHSCGGYSALNLAAHHPEQVAAVCALSALVVGELTGTVGLLVQLANAGSIGQRTFALAVGGMTLSSLSAKATGLSMVREYKQYWQHPATAELISGVQANLPNCDGIALAEFFRAMGNFDIRDVLSGIKAPTLLLTGERDQIVPAWNSVEASKLINHAELVQMPGIGHVPMIEAESETRAAISNWLQRL